MESLIHRLRSIQDIKAGDLLLKETPYIKWIVRVNWVDADSFGYSIQSEQAGGVVSGEDLLDFCTLYLLTFEYNPRTMVRRGV